MQPVIEHHHDSQNVLRLPGNCSIMLYVFTCSTVLLNSSRLQTPGLACASTDGTFSVDCRATASNTTAAAMAETARRETSPHSSSGDVMRWHCHCLWLAGLLDQAAVLRMPADAQASANLGHSGFHGVFRQTTGVCQTSAFLEHDDPKQSSAFQGST